MDVDHKNIHGERLGNKQHFLINGQNACNSPVINWYFINEKDISRWINILRVISGYGSQNDSWWKVKKLVTLVDISSECM